MSDKKCPLVGSAVFGDGQEDNPCELCALIYSLSSVVDESKRELEDTKVMKAFRRMEATLKELKKSHKVCAGCGLCFGGFHIAAETKNIKGLGIVCQWCADEIEKQGLKIFLERMKQGREAYND